MKGLSDAQRSVILAALDGPVMSHTTKRGHVLEGRVISDPVINKHGALLVDPYTFKKDGGWFVRARDLLAAEPELRKGLTKEVITDPLHPDYIEDEARLEASWADHEPDGRKPLPNEARVSSPDRGRSRNDEGDSL